MANMEHVQLAKRGRDAVARWREENPGETLDLNAAYMSHTRMPQVDLRGADMRDSDLMGAMLHRANLSGCHLNPSHMYRANLIEADLTRALLNGANLRGANLSGADLTDADMDRAVLSDANLTGTKLNGVNLSRANLVGANLTGADFSGANLNGASLVRANLTNAKFDGADLYESVLNSPVLTGADFTNGIAGYTVFQNCDLSEVLGLDHMRHDAPSTVGIDTLCRSGGQIPRGFLRDAGVAVAVCDFQEALAGVAPESGDCFISCSAGDVDYARQLQNDLRGHGVRCWLFPEDARGNALVERHSTSDQEEVERWVRTYDKLMLVFTERGIDSETVRNDITQAQELQQDRDQWTLFLVAPNSAISQSRNRLARSLSSAHIVFNLAEGGTDSADYQDEIANLAAHLRQTEPAADGVPKVEDMGL
ncbi:MAG: hypothetical protein BZY80_05920 [SAR202 cluster bacterium Io17-Chloro-G2]|nr:MAG: hypothetical protein BZY80_05920 [SAR202 cluster bacterium Io17-Chloro-G2]